MRISTIAAVALLIASCCTARAQDLSGGAGFDYLSSGQGHYEGWEAHTGYDGIEAGYRGIGGQAMAASGPTLDYALHWHQFIATAGGSYLWVDQGGIKHNELDWRAGAGLQFGPVRALLRYEPFNHSDGLTLTLGLDIAP